jgi:hypothetical protein
MRLKRCWPAGRRNDLIEAGTVIDYEADVPRKWFESFAVRQGAEGVARSAKFKTMRMVDVCIPITGGRELVLSRYTQPEAEHRMLLQRLQLTLPEQPPPKITAQQIPQHASTPAAS